MSWFSNAWNSIKRVGKKVWSTTKSVGKGAFDIAKRVGKTVYQGAKVAHKFASKILPVAKQAAKYIKLIPGIGQGVAAAIDTADSLNNALGEGLDVVDNTIKPALNPIENYQQIPSRIGQLVDGGRQLDAIRKRNAGVVF